MTRFEISIPSRIVFGLGAASEIPGVVRSLGRRAFLLTGSRPGCHGEIEAKIREACDEVAVFSSPGEPDVEAVRAGVAAVRMAGAEVVVAIGGGSVMDLGKAIGALARTGFPVETYLEGVGAGSAIEAAGIPCVAVPTTSGTGAEATRNAVIGVSSHRVKVSLRSPWVLPRVAVVDPTLTVGMPPDLTATTGLDALTQLIESFVCARFNPITDVWCAEGLRRVSHSLRTAHHDGGNLESRADLSLASHLSGLALANAGLGAVHGLAGPLGGMYPIAHGAVCAALLPSVMEANLLALRSRSPMHPALGRYETIARLLTGDPRARAEDGIAWVRALREPFGLGSLAELGVVAAEFPEIVRKASMASSMKANPIGLTQEELSSILEAAWI